MPNPLEVKDDDKTLDRGDDVKSPLDTAGKPGGDEGETPEAKAEREEAEAKAAAAAKGDKLDPDETKETAEEKAEREKLEAEEAAKKNIRIPKSRLDEAQAIARRREAALLEEIDKLKGGKQQQDVAKVVSETRKKIDELQDKYEDLILDGKKDEARKIRKQVEAMRDELVEHQTNVKSAAARNAAVEDLTYNAQLAGLEAQYPALNPESDAFDEEKTDEVAVLLNAFVKAGAKRPDALKRAVKYVFGAPPEVKDTKADEAAQKVAAERAEAARKKAAEADKRQPPSSNGVGKDSDKGGSGKDGSGIDVMRLSQDKFAKLDADTLAKLRGDEV